MNFNWDGLVQNDFVNYCARIESETISDGYYIGCVRVGDLCFDLIVRQYDSWELDYDLYIGGIDDGYGYSQLDAGYPYSEDSGGSFADGLLINLTYDKFKEVVEAALTDFICNEGSVYNVSLIEKANEPLHIW